ncbi:hypothetical protein RJT34_07255 [Clitoria ternatea]|uniref:S-protein homolog n=1 Tax=Clitoria ternatea TaxID=43366 RepID=A0AAN9K398_CLITE
MGFTYGGVRKTFFILPLFCMVTFVASFQTTSESVWGELLHPKLRVTITSKIRGGVVRVKCISSENDIQKGYLDSVNAKPFVFDVGLKLLTTIRYNCLLTQRGREIGQFLGFRSGSYCERGCTWEVYPSYATRISYRHGFVNQTYRPIGSPDDHTYDYS